VIESDLAEGVLFAHGGVGGGHTLYVKDGELVYLYNWLGEKLQFIRGGEITSGHHVYTAEFTKTGIDDVTKSAVGTLKLYIDDEVVGESEIWTQPASFALAGDGLNVGLDRGSPTSPEYLPPFEFEGGEIKKVIVDVSGEPYVDHEMQVRAWMALD
jgi:arylsulfatase